MYRTGKEADSIAATDGNTYDRAISLRAFR